jgi:hypothetical protein
MIFKEISSQEKNTSKNENATGIPPVKNQTFILQ